MAFNLSDFRNKRHTKHLIGLIGFWGGLILLCLDMTTSFPTPERGAYAIWWVPIIVIGAYFYIISRRLPLEEVIEIASDQKYNGELRVHDVVHELGVNIGTAERILYALERKGYASVENREDTQVWVFPDSKDRSRNRY